MQLLQDQPFEVVGYSHALNWFKVKVADGAEGWVSGGDFVKVNAPLDTIPAAYFRPLTGMVQKETKPRGLGEIRINNNDEEDAVVIVQEGSGTIASAYVRAGEKFTITGINDGTYLMFTASGHDWDGKQFNRDVDRARFDEPADFTTSRDQFTYYEVTLRVRDGEGDPTTRVPLDEFPQTVPDIQLERPTGQGASVPAGSNFRPLHMFDFTDNSGGWAIFDDKDETHRITNGQLEFEIKSRDYLTLDWPDTAEPLKDGAIAADTQIGGKGASGLMVRLTETDDTLSFYTCFIGSAGEYSCSKFHNSEWKWMAGPTPSSAINATGSNHLAMTAVGNRITFSINGRQVDSFTDNDLKEGRAGVYAYTTDEPDQITFDNVVISAP